MTLCRLLSLVLLLLLLLVTSTLSQEQGSCLNMEEDSDLPLNYLTATLEPQGIHRLADPTLEPQPMVSKTEFDKGNTLGTGLWECTPGTWTITRPTSESFLILKGKGTIYEADGTTVRVELQAGVWHHTPKGWSGKWIIHETVRKLFIVTE